MQLVLKFCEKVQFQHGLRKPCSFTKFPHQKISWNYSILRSDIVFGNSIRLESNKVQEILDFQKFLSWSELVLSYGVFNRFLIGFGIYSTFIWVTEKRKRIYMDWKLCKWIRFYKKQTQKNWNTRTFSVCLSSYNLPWPFRKSNRVCVSLRSRKQVKVNNVWRQTVTLRE